MDVNTLKVERTIGGSTWINGLILGAIGVLVISIVVLSCVPPISKDALVHDLAVPKLYLDHGGMYEIPSMSFSYYPMNLDLLYVIPLYFGQDIVPKFIHFVFALLTAWIIFSYLKVRTNITFGVLGVLFFLSIPIIVKLSTTVYVDLGVIFFSTASVLLLFKWIEYGFHFGPLVLSAVSCGLAMGTKYNGLITFLLAALLVPFSYSRYSRKGQNRFFNALGYTAIFCLLALTVFSPWMIRNYHWKGNPIYPLYQNWFGLSKHGSIRVVDQKAQGQKMDRGVFTYRNVIYKEKWWEIALLPIRIFYQGKDGDPQHFDGKLNPFLLILPIFAFYRTREGPDQVKREKGILLIYSLLFFFFAFFTQDLRIRYVSPIIPALVILSILGLETIHKAALAIKTETARDISLAVVGLLVIFSMTFNVNYLIDQFRGIQPFVYLKGEISRDDYIARHRPEYPAMLYINKHLPQDSLILFVFLGKRGYYCDRPYIVSGESRMRRLFQKTETPEEILKAFKRQGLTHLVICVPIFSRWIDANFDTEKKKIITELFTKHIKTLYHENGFSVSIIKYPLA